MSLLECHGRRFRARIVDQEVEGMLAVESVVYLCQDEIDGNECNDRLGYSCSWFVDRGTEGDLEREGVTDFELLD